MEDKYYTPSIEEFHVGFEYEAAPIYREMDGSDDVYTKYTFSIGTENNFDRFKYLDQQLSCGLVRVKYLDKEDIESLGFVENKIKDIYGKEIYSKVFYSGFALPDKSSGNIITLAWHPQSKVLDIKREQFGSWGNVKYEMAFKVKNKSELKRLLKQLNIIN